MELHDNIVGDFLQNRMWKWEQTPFFAKKWEWSGTLKNWEPFYLNTYLSFYNVIFRTLCPTAKQTGLRTMWHIQRQNICVAQKRPYGRGEEISLSQSKQGQRQRTVKLTAQQRLSFILAKLVQCSFACGRGLAFISLQRPKSFPA